MRRPALVIEQRLIALRNMEPKLIDAANHALVGIQSKHAGKIFGEKLTHGADIYLLRDIAELGVDAVDAGAAIVNLLNSPDSELRLLAARTLGYIEYIQAEEYLIPLLNEHSDVKLNWVAADSLGRMKSKAAISELTTVADSHWYPPVRDAARKAVEYIKSGKPYESKFHERNFAFEYFNFRHFDINACESITLKSNSKSNEQKLYRSNDIEKLKKLTYSTVILSYGAGDEEQQRAEDPDAVIKVNASNIVQHRHDIEQTPDIALRVGDGWLAGANRGEWGGELTYISNHGTAIKILDENIEDIYKLGSRYIAIAGLAHLTMNSGMIYEVFQDKSGKWRAKKWIKLPGSPRTSWIVETGEILINTNGGGSILLSEAGSLRMATCK